MPVHTQIIHIEPLAPAKPALGAPCNGCGVCCLAEPCPLGMLLSRKRAGACMALRWSAAAQQYRCGAMVASKEVLVAALPVALRWTASAWVPVAAQVLGRLARRWVAAGIGCDSTLEPTSVASLAAPLGANPSLPTFSPTTPHD